MADAPRHDPQHYLAEIRANVAKLRAQAQVTPAENALFGMCDGLAGLVTFVLQEMAEMKRRLDVLESASG
jgi:hypothetical protein